MRKPSVRCRHHTVRSPEQPARAATSVRATRTPDRTYSEARETRHVQIRGFGVSEENALFVRLAFSHQGKRRLRLLPLANLTYASREFDRLSVEGARLFSPQARRELIVRIQATAEDGRRFKVATRLG